MFFDPMGLLITLIGLPLVFLPQMWVQRTYKKYAQVPSMAGRTGAEVARDILMRQGVHHVEVEMSHGLLSDHYDPMSKKVRLSERNYNEASVAAVAVAAHEVGHALQHAQGFFPVVIRGTMVPAVNLGSQFGPLLIMISFILLSMHVLAPSLGLTLAWIGVILFGLAVLFHIVTLPVEIDASMRAVGILQSSQYLTTQELPFAKKVLTAAALTYVAVALYSLMELLYYVWHLVGARRE